MDDKPWTGLIPDVDVMSFPDGANAGQRPVCAGSRPAIIVVDMTHAFVDDHFPHGWNRTGRPAVEANSRLLTDGRRAGLQIFFTKAFAGPEQISFSDEGSRWKIGRDGYEPSPAALLAGDVIVDELAPAPGDTLVYKGDKPSAFFGTPLAAQLIRAGIDTVIVTGMTTSGCVRATVLDAFMLNFHVIVPMECVADRSQISHKVSLFDMHMKYADVISLNETIDYISGGRRRFSAMR